MIPPPPFGYKGNIPLYFPKSEEEYKRDPYEQYHTTVLRNVRNYLMSDFGHQSVDFVKEQIADHDTARFILEIGCGIGYHMVKLAENYQNDAFYGFDTSYQMLKMADELWLGNEKEVITIPPSNQGHEEFLVNRKFFTNVKFSMSKGDLLPVSDAFADIVYSCFLWDRMPDISGFLLEQKRLLKKGGKMIIVSPLNYQKKSSWDQWYPVERMVEKIEKHGFTLIEQQNWIQKERMDKRGNGVEWSVTGLSFLK